MHLDGVQARQTNIFRELEIGWTELDSRYYATCLGQILFQMHCSTGQTSCALLRLNCVQSCNDVDDLLAGLIKALPSICRRENNASTGIES